MQMNTGRQQSEQTCHESQCGVLACSPRTREAEESETGQPRQQQDPASDTWRTGRLDGASAGDK